MGVAAAVVPAPPAHRRAPALPPRFSFFLVRIGPPGAGAPRRRAGLPRESLAVRRGRGATPRIGLPAAPRARVARRVSSPETGTSLLTEVLPLPLPLLRPLRLSHLVRGPRPADLHPRRGRDELTGLEVRPRSGRAGGWGRGESGGGRGWALFLSPTRVATRGESVGFVALARVKLAERAGKFGSLDKRGFGTSVALDAVTEAEGLKGKFLAPRPAPRGRRESWRIAACARGQKHFAVCGRRLTCRTPCFSVACHPEGSIGPARVRSCAIKGRALSQRAHESGGVFAHGAARAHTREARLRLLSDRGQCRDGMWRGSKTATGGSTGREECLPRFLTLRRRTNGQTRALFENERRWPLVADE